MRVLILSFHFPPDLSAGSFRTQALIEAFEPNLDEKCSIDVLTTFPNRYTNFKIQTNDFKKKKNVNIFRVALKKPNNGILNQILNFFQYAKFVLSKTKHEKYDVIYATSSKLMTAVLGAFLSNKKNSPLYLDIRDLFVDTIKDVFPGWKQLLLQPIFRIFEKWSFNSANHINIVSGGFSDYIKTKTDVKCISVHTNGIDEIFIKPNQYLSPKKSRSISTEIGKKPITILYAGNIGEGQALHSVIPKMSQLLGKNYIIKIIGDGAKIGYLKRDIFKTEMVNIEIYPPVAREKIPSLYRNADILFLHLNDHRAFRKVIPSKLFEYAATGKPILAGVSGFPAQFIKDNIKNCEVFEPCNAEQAVKALNNLDLSYEDRHDFIAKFQRKKIMEKMSLEIVQLAGKSACEGKA